MGRAGWPRRDGQLQAFPITRHTKGHETNRHGMVNVAKAAHQYTRSVQVEGAPQRPWRATRTWCTLLGHLRPGGDLANGPSVPDPLPPTGLAEPATRFRYGLPPSTSGDAALHAVAAGIPTMRNDKENTCP